MLLGNALQRIHVFYGYSVIRTDIVNDRGTHICKSMLMYDRYGNGEQPTMKTDHFVGKRYVRFSQELKKDPTLDIEAQHMLQQREE
jgi:arginyl-tRNA synthetase